MVEKNPLKLSEFEESRVEMLVDSGQMDRAQALEATVGKKRGRRIFGHGVMKLILENLHQESDAREVQAAARREARREEVAQIIKETNPGSSGQ